MKTFKELPALVYEVHFSKMQGFFLLERPALKIEEERIYGPYPEKVAKVLSGYEAVDRNFGIILSGHKGVGKTLFTKILASEARKKGYPVIIVSTYFPGIAHFLSSIDQNVVVLFDEFDKTFATIDEIKPQEELLTLFDGLDGGHKLFVITCNELNKLSGYLLNRPGRFHYHFTLGLPSPGEIREYLEDKLAPPYQEHIDSIINLSTLGKLTYDCLRAIAFELNQGFPLSETMADLNITRDHEVTLDVIVEFTDGTIYKAYGQRFNFLGENNWGRWLSPAKMSYGEAIWIAFKPSDIRSDPNNSGELYLPVENVIDYHADSEQIGEEVKRVMEARIQGGLKSVRFVKNSCEEVAKYFLV